MKFSKIIPALSLMILFMTSLRSGAENPTPFKLPSAHISAFERATEVNGENNFESIRAFSPFAKDYSDSSIDETGALINQITEFASKYLGTRYRRGGSDPKAFDCSGFVGYVFRNFGFNLSRSSSSQYREGEKVEKDDLRPGDLMFFSGSAGNKKRVGHVAMVVDVNPDGSCTFIHASTSQGVVYQNFPDGGYYSRRFIGAKRIIPTAPTA